MDDVTKARERGVGSPPFAACDAESPPSDLVCSTQASIGGVELRGWHYSWPRSWDADRVCPFTSAPDSPCGILPRLGARPASTADFPLAPIAGSDEGGHHDPCKFCKLVHGRAALTAVNRLSGHRLAARLHVTPVRKNRCQSDCLAKSSATERHLPRCRHGIRCSPGDVSWRDLTPGPSTAGRNARNVRSVLTAVPSFSPLIAKMAASVH